MPTNRQLAVELRGRGVVVAGGGCLYYGRWTWASVASLYGRNGCLGPGRERRKPAANDMHA